MCLPQISCTAILLAELLHACKIQLHRRGAAKNRYRDFQPAVVVVDLFHASIEIRKRPVHDTHLLVALKNHLGLRSEEHTSELQSQSNLVCRLLLEKKQIHTFCWAVPNSSGSFSFVIDCPTPRPGNESRALGAAFVTSPSEPMLAVTPTVVLSVRTL